MGGHLAGILGLVLLLMPLLVPVGAAQSSTPRIEIRLARAVEGARIVPETTESIEVRVTVTVPESTYCTKDLRLDFAIIAWPVYAQTSIEPQSHVLRNRNPDMALRPPGPVQHEVSSRLIIGIDRTAPALHMGVYTLRANLIAPEDLASCNIKPTHAEVRFAIVTDYVPDTEVKPMGWHPVYYEFYELNVTNHGNGPTSLSVEPIRYDPMAMGKIIVEDMVLDPGASDVLRIRFSPMAPGYHLAELRIRSTFAGPGETRSEDDNVTIEREGEVITQAEAEGRGTPAFQVQPLLLGALALALARRRWS